MDRPLCFCHMACLVSRHGAGGSIRIMSLALLIADMAGVHLPRLQVPCLQARHSVEPPGLSHVLRQGHARPMCTLSQDLVQHAAGGHTNSSCCWPAERGLPWSAGGHLRPSGTAAGAQYLCLRCGAGGCLLRLRPCKLRLLLWGPWCQCPACHWICCRARMCCSTLSGMWLPGSAAVCACPGLITAGCQVAVRGEGRHA